jgi:mRNA interferase RelE/StbE
VFDVLLERGAEKDLRRLPEPIHERLIRAIKGLSKNPRPAGCRKLSGSKNDWRIRVGDYRVICESLMPIRLSELIASDIGEKPIAEVMIC